MTELGAVMIMDGQIYLEDTITTKYIIPEQY
jgi:hypothetical protein